MAGGFLSLTPESYIETQVGWFLNTSIYLSHDGLPSIPSRHMTGLSCDVGGVSRSMSGVLGNGHVT